MNFKAFMTVMYEIAVKTLDRVSLKKNPGLIGLVLQQNIIAGTVHIHWGVDNGKLIQRWHSVNDVFPIRKI
jgi:hypothetical protein